ncbi:glycosyltransferase [Marinimicrobium alkaliphilum]|uniref:glycosyltransferase n=1 Tax=Marinimicrobium alkaliphilum TaxID=2202654 RepID=UPI000DB98758|nr:glycosyltransferase [Marinimicrobium alkaliphilum]
MRLGDGEKLCGPVLVVGNGPSAKLLDFSSPWLRGITTVGMNSAFRFWDKVGFRPTYYICMDDVVIKNIAHDIVRLVDEGLIRQFFLKDSLREVYPELELHKNIVWYSQARREHSIFQNCPVSTGGWAIRWMLSKGSEYIATIGIDGISTEIISESEKDESLGKLGLRVSETPKFNPNYFFSDYQQKGDEYQIPNNPGYAKAKGRQFHEDALLSVHRYCQSHSLRAEVIDLSPLSSHGIFPKGSLHSFKSKTEAVVLIDVMRFGYSETKRFIASKNNRSLFGDVYLILPKSGEYRICEFTGAAGCRVTAIGSDETFGDLLDSLENASCAKNVLALANPLNDAKAFNKEFQLLSVLYPRTSLVALSSSGVDGSGAEVVGAGFNLEKLSATFRDIPISEALSQSIVALLRVSGSNVVGSDFSMTCSRAGGIASAVDSKFVWRLLSELSESFPQISVSQETIRRFSQGKVWIGSSGIDDPVRSFEEAIAFCLPRGCVRRYSFDVLTVKVSGPEFGVGKEVVSRVRSHAESGGMIEWEVSGFGDDFNYENFLSNLNAAYSLKDFCSSYPMQSFVNVDGADVEERIAHSDALLIFKYIMSEGNSNVLELPSMKSETIVLDNGLISCDEFSGVFNPIGVKQAPSDLDLILRCRFDISAISSISFHLSLVSRYDDRLRFRICRDGGTRFESKNFSVPVSKGENCISLSFDFSEIHTGCRLEFLGGDSEDNKILIEGVRSVGTELLSKQKVVEHGDLLAHKALDAKTDHNEEFLRESGSVVAILDPDGVDYRGHYLAYDAKLSESFNAKGILTKILCRNDIKVGGDDGGGEGYIKCFDKNSWTIATNMEVFRREVEEGLRKLVECTRGSKIILYFYTASVHHLSVLCDLARDHGSVYVHLNLFWEMIKDTGSVEYSAAIREAFDKAEKLKGRVVVSAPTAGVQRLVESACGALVPVAPHPCTALSDSEFSSLSSIILEIDNQRELIKRGGGNKEVIFPGASTIHKGYEIGLEAATQLSSLGYSCWVRDEPGYEIDEGIGLIPKELSSEEFKNFLASAGVIVLPYQPEGFGYRTSGLVIDALYLGIPVIAIDGTWLSEVVSHYKSGLCVDSDPASVVDAVSKIIGSTEFSQKDLVKRALAYHANNSWLMLSEFIINEFSFDSINYRYANYLFRQGLYKEAKRIYKLLHFMENYSLYERSIALCDAKLVELN